MTGLDKDFVGSIPEIYDTYLVPLIFEFYAQDLAERVGVLKPETVLETAAGSGVVARAMVGTLPSEAQYVVIRSKLLCVSLVSCFTQIESLDTPKLIGFSNQGVS
jgi:hypothetical protein